jgi:hypothetical protein
MAATEITAPSAEARSFQRRVPARRLLPETLSRTRIV